MRTDIVRTVDQVTGKTVSQLPDKISMQLRAYMRDFIEKSEAQQSGQPAPHYGHRLTADIEARAAQGAAVFFVARVER